MSASRAAAAFAALLIFALPSFAAFAAEDPCSAASKTAEETVKNDCVACIPDPQPNNSEKKIQVGLLCTVSGGGDKTLAYCPPDKSKVQPPGFCKTKYRVGDKEYEVNQTSQPKNGAPAPKTVGEVKALSASLSPKPTETQRVEGEGMHIPDLVPVTDDERSWMVEAGLAAEARGSAYQELVDLEQRLNDAARDGDTMAMNDLPRRIQDAREQFAYLNRQYPPSVAEIEAAENADSRYADELKRYGDGSTFSSQPDSQPDALQPGGCSGLWECTMKAANEAWCTLFGIGGCPAEAAPVKDQIRVGPGGRINTADLYQVAREKFAGSDLIGKAHELDLPESVKDQLFPNGGTADEWARFTVQLCQQESTCSIASVSRDGSLVKFGSTLSHENSYGPFQFNLGEYGLKSWAEVNNPVRGVDALIRVAQADNLDIYFGSIRPTGGILNRNDWFLTSVSPTLRGTPWMQDVGFSGYSPPWETDVGFSGYSPPWQADVGFTGPYDWSNVAFTPAGEGQYFGEQGGVVLRTETVDQGFAGSSDALLAGEGTQDSTGKISGPVEFTPTPVSGYDDPDALTPAFSAGESLLSRTEPTETQKQLFQQWLAAARGDLNAPQEEPENLPPVFQDTSGGEGSGPVHPDVARQQQGTADAFDKFLASRDGKKIAGSDAGNFTEYCQVGGGCYSYSDRKEKWNSEGISSSGIGCGSGSYRGTECQNDYLLENVYKPQAISAASESAAPAFVGTGLGESEPPVFTGGQTVDILADLQQVNPLQKYIDDYVAAWNENLVDWGIAQEQNQDQNIASNDAVEQPVTWFESWNPPMESLPMDAAGDLQNEAEEMQARQGQEVNRQAEEEAARQKTAGEQAAREKTASTVSSLEGKKNLLQQTINQKFKTAEAAKDAANNVYSSFRKEAENLLRDPLLTASEKAKVNSSLKKMDENYRNFIGAMDTATDNPQQAAINAKFKGASAWGLFNYPSPQTQAAARRAVINHIRSIAKSTVMLADQIVSIGDRAANR